MVRRRLAILFVALAGAAAIFVFTRELPTMDLVTLFRSRNAFVDLPLPLSAVYDLMDIGVADVNGDGRLDVYTTNHNSAQYLWVAEEHGGYRDMLSAWDLGQNREFPGLEISQSDPKIDKPGVYIYWRGRDSRSLYTLVIRTHRIKEIGRLEGSLETFTSFQGHEGAGFIVQPPVSVQVPGSLTPRSTLQFASETDGALNLEIVSPGAPITVRLGQTIPLSSVYVGQQKVSPASKEFGLSFQDRHGVAWNDYNDDGWLDAFISRGAIGGTLGMFPQSVQRTIKDELLVSQPGGHYRDVAAEAGIEKRGCSGRKAAWVDYNNDGQLDLFINCQERGTFAGIYRKQFYRQSANGHFVDVAMDVGLDIPDHEVIDFIWFDADNDGYVDLLTSEDTGFYLYRNHGGKYFSRESIGRGKFARADRPQLRGTSDEYWFVDGKLVVGDVDGSGIFSVFSASKMGNVLLVNDGKGHFSIVDPATRGLPGESATASWVDFDNDGLLDLYAAPQGLFRQRRDHMFESTGLLRLPSRKYMAAIVNWADLDNDGRPDMLMAILENFAFWTWWDKLYKASADRFRWKLAAFRNVSNENHWLELKLVGRPGNAQAIGARVTVQTRDGQQTQMIGLNDGAFFSQGQYRLHFGLGAHVSADIIRVRWPNGEPQELANVDGNQVLVVKQPASDIQEIRK